MLLALAAAARTDAGEPSPLGPPEDLTVWQVGYGAQGAVRLLWTNPKSFELIELLVDGDVRGDADGAAAIGHVEGVEPGVHTFGVRSAVGTRRSEIVTVDFTVLDSSPLPDPVRNLSCSFLPDLGGRLRLGWEPGDDPWVGGEVRVTGRAAFVGIGAGTTGLDIGEVGEEPPEIAVAFRNVVGYFSEPIVPPCLPGAPVFLRGDCDGSGEVNLTDAIASLIHLFQSGRRWQCDDACDADDSGEINITDPLVVLNYLFLAGPPPGAPFPECGVDPTSDFLGGVCTCD
jgi:hypothetical protein